MSSREAAPHQRRLLSAKVTHCLHMYVPHSGVVEQSSSSPSGCTIVSLMLKISMERSYHFVRVEYPTTTSRACFIPTVDISSSWPAYINTRTLLRSKQIEPHQLWDGVAYRVTTKTRALREHGHILSPQKSEAFKDSKRNLSRYSCTHRSTESQVELRSSPIVGIATTSRRWR